MQQALGSEGYAIEAQRGPDYERAKRIVDRLARAAGADSFSYPVYIVDAGEDVNAATINNNTVVVYRELLRRVPNDNELATVLAHEIAHAVARHSDDKTSENREKAVGVGSYILGTVAAVAVAAAGGGSAAANLAGNVAEGATGAVGMGAIVRSYDRKLEYEADHVGLMIMAKAGYDPRLAISFWEKAPEIFGDKSGSSFWSTHPGHDDRKENLEEAMPLAMQFYEQARVQIAQAELEQKPSKSKKGNQARKNPKK
jgi:predicted Zn-dependent protease